MLQKPKNWLAEALWKPKKTHSLEQLRYLHYILQRNSTVTEGNKALLVETLRSIAEILIWGDQNDSTVFDFFLEKNMLLFFLKIMTQNCGSYVTVQLLQTLNILFENIKNETSLYFLLSNNHVNSIIVHKFDFSNEEVLAYYISFLKTLSLKLNNQTINFFFNERKSDFPLYTEAIKFFHHQESMVRIAVRTLTLNVCRVGHKKMLEFICDKTATPYFSNLIWLIGKDAIELDDCVVQETDHFKFDKLKASVADHLDHLHYLNDILELKISVLNIILTDHMINRLLIPLYIYSLPMKDDFNQKDPDRVRISKLVALFLLSQHLLIMRHPPLVNSIVDVIFNEDNIRTTAYTPANPLSEDQKSLLSNTSSSSRAFIPPPAPLESQLEAYGVTKDSYNLSNKLKLLSSEKNPKNINSTFYVDNDGTIQVIDDPNLSDKDSEQGSSDFHSFTGDEQSFELTEFNNTKTNEKEKSPLMKDEGKENILNSIHDSEDSGTIQASLQELQLDEGKTDSTEEIFLDSHEELPIVSTEEFRRIFVVNILKSLDCSDEDGEGFFALCLFYSILTNTGIDQELLKEIGLASPSVTEEYNEDIMEQLLVFLEQGVKDGSKMRLVTFEMCVKVIRLMIVDGDVRRTVKDRHYAMLQNILESSTLQLRNFYKGDELFVHTFEGEYHHMKAKPLNVEYVAMDASLLLPATVTPLTGIDFLKRLPCGDDERTQRASHVFILTRELMMDLKNEQEYYLPLSKVTNPVKESEVLDLNNSDLIACTIIQQNKQSTRRFLVIDTSQFILVEPDTRKLGWGLVKFVSHLQDVEASPDKDDSRSLHIVVQQPFSRRSKSGYNPLPILTAKFIFDDYIRCMTARQRLQKRRDALRHRKMTTIATLLELPALAAPPAQFYSIASYDGTPTSVWSPSSRGYSSTRQSPNTSTNNLSLPSMPINANKSKLLSPKHEEILQKKMNKQTVSDDNNDFTAQHTMCLESPSVSTPQKNIADSLASILQTSPSPNFPEINGQATLRSRSETMEIGEEVGEDNVTLSQNNSSYVLLNDTVSVQRENTKTENENQLTNQLKRSSKIITDKTIIEEKKLSDKKRSNSASVGTTKKLDVTNTEESVVSYKKRSTSVTAATNKKLDTDAVEDKKLSNKKRSNSATKKLDVTTTEENLVSDKKRSSSSSEASQSESNSSSELKKCDSAPGSPSGRRKARFDTSNENADRLCKSLPAMAFVSPVATSTDERKQRAQRARAKAKVVKTKVRKTRK